MFKFPKTCTTDMERRDFSAELNEKLRLWHNLECQGKSKIQARIFFDSKFYPRIAEIQKQTAQYHPYLWEEASKSFVKVRGVKGSKWQPSLAMLDYVEDAVPNLIDPLEDLTTYTERDLGSNLTVTAPKVAFASLPRNVSSYVYADKGVNHFSGDYEHLIDVELTSFLSYPVINMWCLANLIGDRYDLQVTQSGDMHSVSFITGTPVMYLQEHVAGSATSDSYNASTGTTYYLKIKRDEAVGANGTLYNYIYLDSDRTILTDTLSVALNEKEDFRYIYCVQSYNDGSALHGTGFAQNLDLQEPEVTTQVGLLVGGGLVDSGLVGGRLA